LSTLLGNFRENCPLLGGKLSTITPGEALKIKGVSVVYNIYLLLQICLYNTQQYCIRDFSTNKQQIFTNEFVVCVSINRLTTKNGERKHIKGILQKRQ